ncbi:P-loop containing nucleoside triphosphate hydrolase protein, partial [Dactylonectria macrodidyma]
SPDDRFIAVMGITGAGKSTFISHLTNGEAKVGHDLSSYTTDMQCFSFDLNGRKVHLIDTPGFDDTFRTDSDVLKDIAFWLHETYKKDVKLSGIVYLHAINHTRITGSVHKNLRLFERLCGDESLKTVVLGTTMWNKEQEDIFTRRQEELKSNPDFWGKMVSRGSTVVRHDNTRESAMSIVTYILDQGKSTVLQIQREMEQGGMKLDQTSAGKMLGQDLDKKREAIESRLRKSERDLDQAIKEGDSETIDIATNDQDQLRRQLEAAIRDREELKITNDKLLEIKEAEYQAQRAKQLAEAQEKQ